MFEFLDDKEFAIEMRLESARVILQIQAEEIDALTKQLEYMRSTIEKYTVGTPLAACNTIPYGNDYWGKGGI